MNNRAKIAGQRWSYTKLVACILAGIGIVVALMFFLDQNRQGSPSPMAGVRRISCEGQLRQLAQAFAMYAEYHGGRLPVDDAEPTLVGSLKLLGAYGLTTRALWCPADGRPGCKPAADFQSLSSSNISYSYVPNLTWQKSHSDAIVALDRIDSPEKGSRWPATLRHDGGGFVLYADGRIDFCRELPVTLKDGRGRTAVLTP